MGSISLKTGLMCRLQLAHKLQSSIYEPFRRYMINLSVICLSSVHMGEGNGLFKAT